MARLSAIGDSGAMEAPSATLRFSTRRERNLWLLTASVVVAIYSTLGLASALALLALFAVIALVGLKGRAPTVFQAAIAVGVVAVYALVFLRMASPIERSHLFEYSLVAILIHEALLERSQAGRRVARPAVLAVGAAAILGIVDELIQLILPNRVFDPIDLAFNAFAAFMGVAVSGAIGRAVRPR